MRIVPAFATMAVLVLAACAPMKYGSQDVTAASAKFVMVSVSKGQVALFPDPVQVGATNGVVKWFFDSDESAYQFPDDGVTFPEPPSAPPPSYMCSRVATAAEAARRFNNCGPKQHGKAFHCNAVGKTPPVGVCYYYALKVEPKAGGAPLVLDPWAKNL